VESEQVSFLCRHCDTHSRSEVIATADWIEYEQDGTYRGGPEYRYRLVRCTACRDVSLLVAMQIAWRDDDTGVYGDDHAVYPAPPRSLSIAIPKNLQRCFQEARSCYQARAYNASAIMCRRALEILALERGIKEGSLARSLVKLKDQGDIDQRLFDWCDALRFAGNQAAHEVDQDVTQADAKDMNDLTEATIDYVYVFQARYEEFKKRRATAP
jgi:hypothetical protein